MTTTLGSIQQEVLDSLVRHGGYPGGWKWRNYSTTERVLDSLVKRGLAAKTTTHGYDHWTATADGLAAVTRWRRR